jgi:ubiquinone/menaquinone biosynthesis C-methylase UbiE
MSQDAWSVYGRMAGSYEAHAADGAYNAHYDRPAVLSLLGDVRGCQVLDAACGPGYYTAELIARGASVTAFDASPKMLALARARVGERVRLERAVLGELLPFADEEFDIVVCALAIHYADDRTSAFREFARVLSPAGVVVFSTQHPTTDWLRKGGSYFDVRQEEDVWERFGKEFTVRFWREPLTTLCAAVAAAGFLIERLVEPLPAESMRERWPSDWEQLHREPGFIAMRLVKAR